MRSSERARDLGEVFTPEETVGEMLDLLEDVNYSSRYLEPGCGDGNFLVQILVRKADAVSKLPEVIADKKSGKLNELEFKLIVALGAIYGIDIDKLNIVEAQERILETFIATYQRITKVSEIPDYLINAAKSVIGTNIVLGDLTDTSNNIEIVEYAELPKRMLKRRVFKFQDLLFPEDEVFDDIPQLFGHVPQAIREHPPINYRDLGNE